MTNNTISADAEKQLRTNNDMLPEYIVWNEHTDSTSVIRNPAQKLKFPLTEQDRADIQTLDDKYEAELINQGVQASQC